MSGGLPSPLQVSQPSISIDGRDDASLSHGLLRLSIRESVRGGRRCEATFTNWGPVGESLGYVYFDRRILDFGKSLQVKLQADLLFDGRITAIEARFPETSAPEITVRAEDRQPPAPPNAGTLALSYGAALREFTVSADLAGQYTSLAVTGWDPASKSAITQEADESTISGELNGGDSGPSILKSSFGERRKIISDAAPLDSAEAQARAEALFRTSARRFVTSRGIADTNVLLRVGASVDLQQLGPLFSGQYDVIEVHHTFDATKGLRTEFVAQRPALGRP